jgi:16S rRNA (guanine527-N7)-methyltransferase
VAEDVEVRPSLEHLGESFGLSGRQLDQLGEVIAVLSADRYAPTTVTEPTAALNVHLADSLVALELDLMREAVHIADMGAGAGFPGIALAVALPHCEVKLVESQARKCAFIERLKLAANVGNVEVVCARVEEWPEGIGAHDAVLARALAAQPVVLEYAAPLLGLGGALVDWRGRRNPEEERIAAETAEILGLRLDSIRRVEPYEGVRDHHLHVYVKVRDTPDGFPRRAGVASKKPLIA